MALPEINATPALAWSGPINSNARHRGVQCIPGDSDDWYHFPFLTGNRFRPVSSGEWNSVPRLYYLWWMRHLPHVEGSCDGVALNWWRYILDPNTI